MKSVMDDSFDLLRIDFALASAPWFDTSERFNAVRLEPPTPFTNSDNRNAQLLSDMGVGLSLCRE